jgi:hypothetical protein
VDGSNALECIDQAWPEPLADELIERLLVLLRRQAVPGLECWAADLLKYSGEYRWHGFSSFCSASL